MSAPPFVNDLWSGDSHTLGDFVGSDEIVYVHLAPHGPILGNPCLQVVYARTQTYHVSTNIYT